MDKILAMLFACSIVLAGCMDLTDDEVEKIVDEIVEIPGCNADETAYNYDKDDSNNNACLTEMVLKGSVTNFINLLDNGPGPDEMMGMSMEGSGSMEGQNLDWTSVSVSSPTGQYMSFELNMGMPVWSQSQLITSASDGTTLMQVDYNGAQMLMNSATDFSSFNSIDMNDDDGNDDTSDDTFDNDVDWNTFPYCEWEGEDTDTRWYCSEDNQDGTDGFDDWWYLCELDSLNGMWYCSDDFGQSPNWANTANDTRHLGAVVDDDSVMGDDGTDDMDLPSVEIPDGFDPSTALFEAGLATDSGYSFSTTLNDGMGYSLTMTFALGMDFKVKSLNMVETMGEETTTSSVTILDDITSMKYLDIDYTLPYHALPFTVSLIDQNYGEVMWMCDDGQEIQEDWVNDGYEDCQDGSDEFSHDDGHADDGDMSGEEGDGGDDSDDQSDYPNNQEDCEAAGGLWLTEEWESEDDMESGSDGTTMNSESYCDLSGNDIASEEDMFAGMDVSLDWFDLMLSNITAWGADSDRPADDMETMNLYWMNNSLYHIEEMEVDSDCDGIHNSEDNTCTTALGINVTESDSNMMIWSYDESFEISDVKVLYAYNHDTDSGIMVGIVLNETDDDMFLCDNGDEIDYAYYDDGNDDCGDWSDEPNHEDDGPDDHGDEVSEDTEDFMDIADDDADGMLSLDEWIDFWNETNNDEFGEGLSQDDIDAFTELFEGYDYDYTDELDLNELEDLLTSIMGSDDDQGSNSTGTNAEALTFAQDYVDTESGYHNQPGFELANVFNLAVESDGENVTGGLGGDSSEECGMNWPSDNYHIAIYSFVSEYVLVEGSAIGCFLDDANLDQTYGYVAEDMENEWFNTDVERTFTCDNGDEILFSDVNNGFQDCYEDGADEQQYDSNNNPINSFDCDDGSQVWIYQVNDDVEDCSMGEDESIEDSDDDSEEPENFACYDTIMEEYDYVRNLTDCEDNGFIWMNLNDDHNENGIVDDEEFLCDNGNIIHDDLVNNENDDCGDGSDEYSDDGNGDDDQGDDESEEWRYDCLYFVDAGSTVYDDNGDASFNDSWISDELNYLSSLCGTVVEEPDMYQINEDEAGDGNITLTEATDYFAYEDDEDWMTFIHSAFMCSDYNADSMLDLVEFSSFYSFISPEENIAMLLCEMDLDQSGEVSPNEFGLWKNQSNQMSDEDWNDFLSGWYTIDTDNSGGLNAVELAEMLSSDDDDEINEENESDVENDREGLYAWIITNSQDMPMEGTFSDYSIVLAQCTMEDTEDSDSMAMDLDNTPTMDCSEDVMKLSIADAMADNAAITFYDADESGTVSEGDVIMVNNDTGDWNTVRLHSSSANAYSDENPMMAPGFTGALGMLALLGAALLTRRD